ncbi:MAG: 30S ribosomal protein S16 [Candidatus Staskawiczbacteria bacterium RIFOXYD2_FULL_37_9]|uniref:Small ribosomal subunit protein bS16 n=1 Tax=Candidatus Staskawiczbacteria bacterium RIFOXYB1_FULL_37_44 TaxID=1802223 RepID=A0A1G2IW27_9BACT|nr:MAG: 30S ribosomal protein S16 [Candidatus Staskawiczbacteria bacterium RIFOXYB1_FULL_37_44]OGZ84123.1 MAG: 30S ribosomal protein S16 [Candidatus Staskawiczbacteria bacterium RIFOXYC1_FULL_37_52]OGZ89015.1 MAG: 30S ribosomal protein S16 [Candidatus Staskawiczbacteria bacterium RIFOXYD1_FULL_37_110]OGZ94595.1 MAG: 30S ribosomal protein S16 [Candidatus Staskawiczbacteria bacterium RIFOXYD2_FULL_37_9]
MLTIRLTRKGKKNQPFFRVVLVDKRRSSTGGRAVEDLGYVDPLKKRKSFKKERILYWISKGAKPSATIHNLLISEKIVDEKKVKIFNISKKKQTEISKAKTDAAAVIASETKKSQPSMEEAKPEIPAETPPAGEKKQI